MATAAVLARGLCKAYGDRVAVDGIDLRVERGECFGFLGPNGAGKTTIMRMLSCLSSRDAGDLAVLGLDPDHDPTALKARLGVVPQEINLDLELTVLQNMLVYARYFGIRRTDARERAHELLAFVGIGDRADDAVHQLSGGMKRRLQIARALINDPEMVLLDEPTTGLDPRARRLVWERLRDLRARGTSVIITTHYMDEAERLCDRLVVIDRGTIVREGSPAQLIRDDVGAEVLEMRVPSGLATAVATIASPRHMVLDDMVWAFGDSAATMGRRVRASGIPVDIIAERRATLEDLFIVLTGHSLGDGALED
ncbi:MAG: ABC transporter ATP-binding protein [Thermoleophilia bacterium]|nr:ABC transporter ATP-binding protein [Thermoleophilia bacterium]